MMEKIWFTSDNHFGHKKIMEFCSNSRPFKDIDEMREKMIKKWNSQVSHGDRVYCLGDFSFYKSDKTEEILKRLNGNLYMILGNHDYWVNENTKKYFEWIGDYKKIEIDKKKVILFHYPIVQFDQMHHGSYHLYGHVHGSLVFEGRAMDVGIDTRDDYGLWEWSEIDRILKDRPVGKHHGK